MVKKLDVELLDEGAAALLAADESPMIIAVFPVDEYATGDSTATASIPPLDILHYLEDIVVPVPGERLILEDLLHPSTLSAELQVDETPSVKPVVLERNTPAEAVETYSLDGASDCVGKMRPDPQGMVLSGSRQRRMQLFIEKCLRCRILMGKARK
jgi:hypothetical protein